MKELQVGIYKHYKGGEYQLLYVAKNEKDQKETVVYKSLSDNKIWTRPLSQWIELIEMDEKSVKRIEYIRASEEDSMENKYKRALADYQNLLKTSLKEKQDFAKFALNSFLQDLLPVYDHLKMSINTLPSSEHDNAWVKGVEYVLKQFKDILNDNGVKEIKTVGEKFDHNFMEAIEGDGPHLITEIMSGYTLHDRLIRPAKVKVGIEKIKNN